MKPALPFKIAIVLVHVLACTWLLLATHQADEGFSRDAADSTAMWARSALEAE
ncbi:MAG: hypothetical protein ACLGI6_11200 [Gammaproteobacteria bacterium]